MVAMVPSIFRTLIRPHLRKLDHTLTPALTQLTWSSLNVNSFLNKMEKNIKNFEIFIKDVSLRREVVKIPSSDKFISLYECLRLQ